MEHDLRRLIDDPRFREYHEKIAKRREFNTFDVLRYADHETRHSNVLAWLFQPVDQIRPEISMKPESLGARQTTRNTIGILAVSARLPL